MKKMLFLVLVLFVVLAVNLKADTICKMVAGQLVPVSESDLVSGQEYAIVDDDGVIVDMFTCSGDDDPFDPDIDLPPSPDSAR